jgi:hypothetical protein
MSYVQVTDRPTEQRQKNGRTTMSDLIKTYLPNVYRFGSTDDDGLTQVHYIVCKDGEQATGFANALFDGSPKQGSVTAPELVADYCFIHDAYVDELAAEDRERNSKLQAENDRLRKALRTISTGDEVLLRQYAASIAKASLEENDE